MRVDGQDALGLRHSQNGTATTHDSGKGIESSGRENRAQAPRRTAVLAQVTFMNLIDAMNVGLMRDDSTEFVVMAGRPPCVRVAGEYKPIDSRLATEDDVLEML